FFASRRRHTRSKRDWSSDVCSSDLSKDFIHSDLSDYAGDQLHVNLTEKVGNNTWYRGKINGEGQNVCLHSSFVFKPEENTTSKLVRINYDKYKVYTYIQ